MNIEITTKRGKEYVVENIGSTTFQELIDLIGAANGGFVTFDCFSINTTTIESIKLF